MNKGALLPAEVTIAGVVYPVTVKEKPIIRTGSVCYGAIDYEVPLIALDGNLEGTRTELTLTHEIVHGLIYDRGLGKMLGDSEEEFVQKFSRGLYAFLKDNDLWFKPNENPAPVSGEVNFDLGHGAQTNRIQSQKPNEAAQPRSEEPPKPTPDPHRPPDGFGVAGLSMDVTAPIISSLTQTVVKALRMTADALESPSTAPFFKYQSEGKGFIGNGEIGIRYKYGTMEPKRLGTAE